MSIRSIGDLHDFCSIMGFIEHTLPAQQLEKQQDKNAWNLCFIFLYFPGKLLQNGSLGADFCLGNENP